MSRKMLYGVSALALAACVMNGSPATAQLVDVTVEGPIQSFPYTAATETTPASLGAPVAIVGTMKVMGITVKVRADASIHSPSNDALTFSDISTVPFPGRLEPGFLKGTGIIAGDSVAGIIYAKDVFVEIGEHVVVGEATGTNPVTNKYTIQKMDMQPSHDPRMPFVVSINGLGFAISDTNITPGTLVAAEGWFSVSDDALVYHTLEADAAGLLNAGVNETSIFRAQCRIRGGNRDELSLRGGVHGVGGVVPAGTVQIERRTGTGTWIVVGPSGAVIPDPATGVPQQAEWRFDNTRQNLGGTCPSLLRATWQGSSATATPDIR